MKANVPANVGVPVIAPVAVFRVIPVGSAPVRTFHAPVAGIVPEPAATVWVYEFATLIVEVENAGVVMTGGVKLTVAVTVDVEVAPKRSVIE